MNLGFNNKMQKCQDVTPGDYATRYTINTGDIAENVAFEIWRDAIIPKQHEWVRRLNFPSSEKVTPQSFTFDIPNINSVIGDPIFPGSITIVTGESGTGKTTFLMQVFGEQARYRKVGYVSGEQNVQFLKQICDNCCVADVDIGNISDVDEICDLMSQYNMLVIDSFPCLHYDVNKYGKMTKLAAEQFMLDKLAIAAQQNKCALFIILHSTKAGTYKGSTFFIHTVDNMINLKRTDNGYVSVVLEKSRLSSPSQINIKMGKNGFDCIRTFIPLDIDYRITGVNYINMTCEDIWTRGNLINIRYDKEYAIQSVLNNSRISSKFWLAIRSLKYYYKKYKEEAIDSRISNILKRRQ